MDFGPDPLAMPWAYGEWLNTDGRAYLPESHRTNERLYLVAVEEMADAAIIYMYLDSAVTPLEVPLLVPAGTHS
jgi:hypothetical protein